MTNLTLVKFIAITSLKCCKFSPHMASHLENWHLWSGLQAILAFLVSWSDFQTYSCVTWAKIWPKRALSENFGFQPLLDFQNMPRWNQWQLNCRRTRMKCRCGMWYATCLQDWLVTFAGYGWQVIWYQNWHNHFPPGQNKLFNCYLICITPTHEQYTLHSVTV